MKEYVYFLFCAIVMYCCVYSSTNTTTSNLESIKAYNDVDKNIDRLLTMVEGKSKKRLDMWKNFHARKVNFVLVTESVFIEKTTKKEDRIIIADKNSIFKFSGKRRYNDNPSWRSINFSQFGILHTVLFIIEPTMESPDEEFNYCIKCILFSLTLKDFTEKNIEDHGLKRKNTNLQTNIENCIEVLSHNKNLELCSEKLEKKAKRKSKIECEDHLNNCINRYIINMHANIRKFGHSKLQKIQKHEIKEYLQKNINIHSKYLQNKIEKITDTREAAHRIFLDYMESCLQRKTNIIRRTVYNPERMEEAVESVFRQICCKCIDFKTTRMQTYMCYENPAGSTIIAIKFFLKNPFIRMDFRTININIIDMRKGMLARANRLTHNQNEKILILFQKMVIVLDTINLIFSSDELRENSIEKIEEICKDIHNVFVEAYSQTIPNFTAKDIYLDMYKLLASFYKKLPYSYVQLFSTKEPTETFSVKKNYQLVGKSIFNDQRYQKWEIDISKNSLESEGALKHTISNIKCTEKFYACDGSVKKAMHYHVHYVDNTQHKYERICIPYYYKEDKKPICVHTVADIITYIMGIKDVVKADIHPYIMNIETNKWSKVKQPETIMMDRIERNFFIVFYHVLNDCAKDGVFFVELPTKKEAEVKLPLFLSRVEAALCCTEELLMAMKETIMHSLDLEGACPFVLTNTESAMWSNPFIRAFYDNLVISSICSIENLQCLVMNASLCVDSDGGRVTWMVKYPYNANEYNFCLLSNVSLKQLNMEFDLQNTIAGMCVSSIMELPRNIEVVGRHQSGKHFYLQGNELINYLEKLIKDKKKTLCPEIDAPQQMQIEIIQTDPSVAGTFNMHQYFLKCIAGLQWIE
ncbi:hypothetical protein NEPAR04_1248 [Nematocida parisii]|nr:hypothetical protein NEPAR08_1306 [Nematocida parisii]KAI5128567.1 hypothetical protein NEPAR03_1374 [Nematocida parisii]KAI5141865.1 hypothetical protein NEPAR04_1248 [Nematocida parisii]